MPPHGPGMIGVLHSHDPEYPDDNWNLYSQLDKDVTTTLNAVKPQDTVSIFKPWVRRLDPPPSPTLSSDADEEMMVVATFSSPAHIRKLMFIGGGDTSEHPNKVKCYINKPDIDFSGLEGYLPVQEFELPVNQDGTLELFTAPAREWTNVYSVAFFFPSNHGGGDVTTLSYIGMQGEHTHYRREAVHADYEVLCNGQDIVQPEDAARMGLDSQYHGGGAGPGGHGGGHH